MFLKGVECRETWWPHSVAGILNATEMVHCMLCEFHLDLKKEWHTNACSMITTITLKAYKIK